jgi:hypothetical protein
MVTIVACVGIYKLFKLIYVVQLDYWRILFNRSITLSFVLLTDHFLLIKSLNLPFPITLNF